MLTPPEPDAYARRLQRVCSSRVTLKYVTLTLTLTLMFAHPPQPRIELHACGYAHVTGTYTSHDVRRSLGDVLSDLWLSEEGVILL